MLERQRKKVEAAVSRQLELDEHMRAAFIGQTPIPPITYLLIGPILFLPIIKFRTIVVTERHLYVFSHKWMRSYEYTGEPYKVEIERARLESGATWARVDGATTSWPRTCPVRPDRSTSQPSMQSAPNAIAEMSVMTFAPGFAAPGRLPRSTAFSMSAAIPSRAASVAGNAFRRPRPPERRRTRPARHPVRPPRHRAP